MESIVISMVLGYVVKDIAAAGGAYDWAGLKAKAKAAIESLIKYQIIDQPLEASVDQLLDGLAKALQDQTDIKSALAALAAKNPAAALAALKAIVQPLLGGELAALVAAA